ncbi:RES family NAD+ phosphorylase [Siminovitchia fordii]|uniref:RES domain-containing protein n=1 Tax=Siminovitchia fordii TaxID=254759 RepID=A0ABQ4KAK7_9BACI|nr:RES family NAD+ phosphorylase [Siminovitchia fordii]GIN22247.1 hypothetical protein J1TS3_33810 [Siminovitchia fordii]
MNCCVECFKDSEIRSIIKSLNEIGNCDFCYKSAIFIYNIDRNDNLTPYFNELIEIYTPISLMQEEMKEHRADFSLLKDKLNTFWEIFNVDSSIVYKILIEICKEKYESAPEVFDEPVGFAKLYDYEFQEENSILGNQSWNEFTEGIKYQSRFHLKTFNTKVFADIIDFASVKFEKGNTFYRARLSNERNEAFPKSEMGAPKKGKASNGRVNPLGISCLYLASRPLVSVKEIRAGIHDLVSIAPFELIEDIEVINLINLDKISPLLGLNHEIHAINKSHLKHIAQEIIRPLKGSNPNLEYLPSQYICDLIKSEGKQGVMYKSTVDENGYNIAIFDESLLECKEVSFHEVTKIEYVVNPELLI